jgi:hypothetical protein
MLRIIFLLTTIFVITTISEGQTAEDILNFLNKKGNISQAEADSIKGACTAKQRDQESRQDSIPLSIGRMLRLSGYTQVRYQYYQQQGKTSGFEIRRARLD